MMPSRAVLVNHIILTNTSIPISVSSSWDSGARLALTHGHGVRLEVLLHGIVIRRSFQLSLCHSIVLIGLLRHSQSCLIVSLWVILWLELVLVLGVHDWSVVRGGMVHLVGLSIEM